MSILLTRIGLHINVLGTRKQGPSETEKTVKFEGDGGHLFGLFKLTLYRCSGATCNGLATHPGRGKVLLFTSRYRNRGQTPVLKSQLAPRILSSGTNFSVHVLQPILNKIMVKSCLSRQAFRTGAAWQNYIFIEIWLIFNAN